jgi:hypothetical protein
MQTVDMMTYLQQLGWTKDTVFLIDMDAGVSGTKKIDERPGMRLLFDLITEEKIGVVACQDEDRLFRDVTQIQVNIFIEACRMANVLVLTPTMIYDFANELTGTFHARQFRFKSEMAAEYLHTVVLGKLHRARRRLLLDGRWAGTNVPPGYIVDLRKTLPDGTPNPHWRRYVAYEPIAEIIREYFRLFLIFAGNLRKTIMHIHTHGPFFPPLTPSDVPDGFCFVSKARKRYGHRYAPPRNTLLSILTNPSYIGHWIVDDQVIHWNNHPAIVPVEDFMRAFNYLSAVSLDGHDNKHYIPRQQHTRPSRDEHRPEERPLCAGMIVSPFRGELHAVCTHWVLNPPHYKYHFNYDRPTEQYSWRRSARPIDEAIEALLQEKLRATFDTDVWDATLATFNDAHAGERKRRQAQLTALRTVMDNQIASLDHLTNQEMVAVVQRRYEEAKAEYNRLSAEIVSADEEASKVKQVYALKHTCGPALERWATLSRDEKRILLDAFITQIEAISVSRYELEVTIHWRDGQADTFTLRSQPTNEQFRAKHYWLASETQRLFSLLDAGATQLELAAAFPARKWVEIRSKVRHERGSGIRIPRCGIQEYETYDEYCRRRRIEGVSSEEMNVSSGDCSSRTAPL